MHETRGVAKSAVKPSLVRRTVATLCGSAPFAIWTPDCAFGFQIATAPTPPEYGPLHRVREKGKPPCPQMITTGRNRRRWQSPMRAISNSSAAVTALILSQDARLLRVLALLRR